MDSFAARKEMLGVR